MMARVYTFAGSVVQRNTKTGGATNAMVIELHPGAPTNRR